MIYVEPHVYPPLPKETIIDGHQCRIWHKSQKNFCKRCQTHGHRTTDIEVCEAYDADTSVVAFRANANPLSNFFICTITIDNIKFRSAEHAYQWRKCIHASHTDLADRILAAGTPADAKSISSELKSNENIIESWNDIKNCEMKCVLKAKWNCSGRFRQTLMSTANMTIAEATQDTYWGVGVAPNIAQHTKPTKFLGRNQLGKLLHLIRSEVQESVDKDGSSYYGFIFPLTHENSDVPLISNCDHEDILTTPPCEVTKKHDLLKNKLQQQDSLHPQTKTNKMTALNDSIDAHSQQLTSSHGALTPCPPPRSRSKSVKKCGKKGNSVASVSSEKRKASTNSDIVSSIHVSKILRADDEGIS